jgi:putative cell wall-binding protein
VLGGTAAVSDAVLQELRGYTAGPVTRLAGESRYTTAARMAQVFWPQPSDVVYLATGQDFPDALTGVPAAGRDRAPLLLVRPDCMPVATRRELHRLDPSTVVVLGGSRTINEEAATGSRLCAAVASP